MFLRIVGCLSTNYTALCPRRVSSSGISLSGAQYRLHTKGLVDCYVMYFTLTVFKV
jgi:hypothetical protein